MTRASQLESILDRNAIQQQDVARALGVRPETLSRWVRGHVAPTGANLVALLMFLRKYEPALDVADVVGRADGGSLS